MSKFEEVIRENREKAGEERISEYHKRAAILADMLKSEHPPYIEQLAKLEEARRVLYFDRPAPDFKTTPFPYQVMAAYDFSLQPHLSPDQSNEETMSLHRVLDDLGVPLTERVIKTHYANIVHAVDDQGRRSYEILTANPKSADYERSGFYHTTSVGSTHSDIETTQHTRVRQGARYSETIPDLLDAGADVRGIIFQTLSGKLYGIWNILHPHNLQSGTNSLQEVENMVPKYLREPKLDKALLEDFSRRYNILVLSGKFAQDLLLNTIWEEFMNTAAIRIIQRTQHPLTNTNLMRAGLYLKAGIIPDLDS